MAELGLIGLIMLILIFVKIFYDTFVNKYVFKSFLSQNRLIIPFMFLFFIEIFPVKTTGSFLQLKHNLSLLDNVSNRGFIKKKI